MGQSDRVTEIVREEESELRGQERKRERERERERMYLVRESMCVCVWERGCMCV